ncbi:MAG: Gfo/Idh/MocA family oxidoreductase [Spirochaetes bacterium]|nr:Gfo/Idh/MocA family oxidoreductase [Spirochaetota bacterium]
MKKIKWGVLSVSTHYSLRIHDQLAESERCEVIAIASRDKARAEAEAARLCIPRAYGSYEALLADSQIEAVYIPLPNHLHAEWIKKAAAAGKHVLCEKPFALNAAQAADAVAFARSRKVLVMEAFMYRFHPQWRRARRIARSGELGKIVAVQSRFSFDNRDPKNIRNILGAGGGAIMDIGCYAVSSARYILGSEPRRVVSLLSRDPQFGTDILSSAILDFGLARAEFTVGTQISPSQKVEILGSSGSLTVELPFNVYEELAGNLTVRTGLGTRVVPCGPAGQYRLMFEAFAEALAEGRPEPTPPEDAIANMKVLDALFRSEKSGGWENLG